MKDQFLKAYQARIEEIKALDVSPEEKRELAANAKQEILEQYKESYIKEKEDELDNQNQSESKEQKSEDVVAKESDTIDLKQESKPQQESTEDSEPKETEKQEDTDDITNILSKLEARDERGEVGVELEEPTSFLSPDELFSTMDLDELFAGIDVDDSDLPDEESFDDIILDSSELFAAFDEIIGAQDSSEDEVSLDDFDLDNDEGADLDEFNLDDEKSAISSANDTIELSNTLKEINGDDEDSDRFNVVVDEVEEISEGQIVDDEDLENDDYLEEELSELEELEKERERAQKLGFIEMLLLIVLIILVVIVVYLIIGV